MSELFENVMRTEYTITASGIKVPHSDWDRPVEFYEGLRENDHTGDEFATVCRFKDQNVALYDRRWQSAKAVIDLVAKEVGINPEKCGICLYGLVQDREEFSSPLVDEMRTWFDKSGDKIKMKRRIAELENQLSALRAALNSDRF